MPTAIIFPTGDGSRGSWENQAAGTTNLYQSIDELVSFADDADYLFAASTSPLFLLLADMPTDFASATGFTARIRAKEVAPVGGGRTLTLQLFKSDETTALTNALATPELPILFGDYALFFTITGDTDKTSWDGARLKLTPSHGDIEVSALHTEVSYSSAASDTGTANLLEAARTVSGAGTAVLAGSGELLTTPLSLAGTATAHLAGDLQLLRTLLLAGLMDPPPEAEMSVSRAAATLSAAAVHSGGSALLRLRRRQAAL